MNQEALRFLRSAERYEVQFQDNCQVAPIRTATKEKNLPLGVRRRADKVLRTVTRKLESRSTSI